MAWRGCEEKLVETKHDLIERTFAHNLRVWSVHLPFGYGWDIAHYDEAERDAACETLKRVIDLTAPWGAHVYVLHGCLEPVSIEQRPVRIARSIRSLRRLDEVCHGTARTHSYLEDLPRSCLANNSTETRAMSQAAGDVPICFDVNHLLGRKPHRLYEALKHNILITTHLSDYDGVDEAPLAAGRGIVPWKEVAPR